MNSPKKRFIAGATCPRCSAQDTIVTYRLDDTDYRECVACGFNDALRLQSPPRELATRVNLTARDQSEQTQAVRILELDPNPERNKKS